MSFAWGVGNVSSNAADLARFAQALFGGELVRPETLATMQSFVASGGAWDMPNFSYGLGMMQYVFPAAQPTLGRGHTGALVGYRTSLWFFPERGVVVVAAVNQMTFDSDKLVTRALDVLRAHGAL